MNVNKTCATADGSTNWKSTLLRQKQSLSEELQLTKVRKHLE